eukprot:6185603-Pleurochrysis_carterae.AAC.6
MPCRIDGMHPLPHPVSSAFGSAPLHCSDARSAPLLAPAARVSRGLSRQLVAQRGVSAAARQLGSCFQTHAPGVAIASL